MATSSWFSAILLNTMTDFAHTDVSMLEKMFNTLRIPMKFANDTSCKSVLTSDTSGARLPTDGNSPYAWQLLPA